MSYRTSYRTKTLMLAAVALALAATQAQVTAQAQSKWNLPSAYPQDNPHVEARDLRRLVKYGNLLRLVDAIFWDTVGIRGDTYE